MHCPKCQFENPEGMKSCQECGCPLESSGSESGMARPPVKADSLTSDSTPEIAPRHPICIARGSRCLLDMILQASVCLTKTMDVDHFLEAVTVELVKGIEVEAAGVLLYDGHANDFRWRHVCDEHGVLAPGGPERRLKIDRTALDRSFQTGEPLVIRDGADTSAPQTDCGVRGDALIHDALIIPLNTREETTGLLVLVNKNAGGFTAEDMRIGVSVAGLVAASVESAEFFEEVLASSKKLDGFRRMKSKILNRLSHELRTPLAIIEGSIKTMEKKMLRRGITGFDTDLGRLNRQAQNLGRLELQVESIMKTGYAEERGLLSRLLESAASLIEVQAEQAPEIKIAASLILKTVQDAFPVHCEQWRKIRIGQFAASVFEQARSLAAAQGRDVRLACDLEDGSEVLIPEQVLRATIEGIIRNAVEATPDNGMVTAQGRRNGELYSIIVEDSGVGIPDEDWGLVFEGFYQAQETEDYTSGRPYSFNAGGKGMDLFRIRTFSRIYGFGLYFKSRRCRHLNESLRECPGRVDRCPFCRSVQDCIDTGGTVFEVELPLARGHAGHSGGE